MPSLKLCICSNRHHPPQFTACLTLLGIQLARDPETFPRIGLFLQPMASNLPFGRQNAVAQCQADGYTHMLFLDDDMTFPADAAHRLFAHGKRIVGVNYRKKQEDYHYVTKDLEDRELCSRSLTGVQDVSRIGLGLALIDMDVFRSVPMPHFEIPWKHDVEGGGYTSEDIYFCNKLRAAGEQIWVDHDLSKQCGHIGDHVYSMPNGENEWPTRRLKPI